MGFVIIGFVLLLLVFGPGLWVRRVMARYSKPDDRYSGTGAELARYLLRKSGIDGVGVEETPDGDHYDPATRTVRLTPDKFNGRSLTAITVAAHEVGHAIQDASGYRPLKYRSRLVLATRVAERAGAAILIAAPFLGALTRAPQLGVLMFAGGLLTLGSSVLVHAMTLPTEFDASFGRALPLLDRERILKDVDRPHARRLLTAAACTYVAASLMSLLNVARWIAILRR